ncbi:MAG: GntR family transcriptional regulator [Chloroflexota bacterium]
MVQIDTESRLPIYAQITEQIKAQIAAGQLKPGDQLPTIRQLATDLRINFNTVVRAYFELEREGLISTQRGRGTFVADSPEEESLTHMREEKMRLIIVTALDELANLGYSRREVEQTFQNKLEKVFSRVKAH